MSEPTTATPEMGEALWKQSVVDVIAVVGTTIEAEIDGQDIADWVASQTQHWTRDHGRAAVMIIGLLLATSGIPAEALASLGRALIHKD